MVILTLPVSFDGRVNQATIAVGAQPDRRRGNARVKLIRERTGETDRDLVSWTDRDARHVESVRWEDAPVLVLITFYPRPLPGSKRVFA